MSHRSQKITAALVTRDDGATLARALASLRWADEIVIVDAGSQDDTLAIAREYTDRVFYHPCEDLCVLRRFAVSQARHPWVLSLSPDEWVDEMLAHKIDGLLISASVEQGARIPIHTLWQGRRLRHGAPLRRECRLFRREAARYIEDSDDHDGSGGFEADGHLASLDGAIVCEPAPTVALWVARARRRAERQAGFRVESGELRRLGKPGAWALLREFEKRCGSALSGAAASWTASVV